MLRKSLFRAKASFIDSVPNGFIYMVSPATMTGSQSEFGSTKKHTKQIILTFEMFYIPIRIMPFNCLFNHRIVY